MYVSIVLVRYQNPQDLVDLKANLNVEFEYVGNELSILGLKEVVWCALKYERSHLKGLWEKNPSSVPSPDILYKNGKKNSCIGIL